MLRALVFGSVVLAGCVTRQECLEENHRFLEALERDGGLVEVCGPDKEMMIVHFEGPPGVVTHCHPVDYPDRLPDCANLPFDEMPTSERAICRAAAAFPDQLDLLGPDVRVDATGAGEYWRIRFASAETNANQRGILIILESDSRSDPVAILY